MPRVFLAVLLLASVVVPASAETLLLDQVEATKGVGPHNGVTMETVRERYGEPQTREGPVGDPPITRWQYDGFAVYFERNLVIHTVVRR